MNKHGYLYILTNVSIPGKVKIGMTERNPEDRRKEISSATGVPTPFDLIHSAYFEDCHFAEKKLHERLFQEGKRTKRDREFFDIDVDVAIHLIDDLAKELNHPSSSNVNVKDIIGLGIKWFYGDNETLKNESRALEYFERAAFLGSPVGSYWAGLCCESLANKIRKKADKKPWQQRALNHYREAMNKKYLKSFAKASWLYRQFDQKNEADQTWNNFIRLVNESDKIDKDVARWLNKWIGQQIEWGYKKNLSKHPFIKKHQIVLLENIDTKNDPKGFVKQYLKSSNKLLFGFCFLLIILSLLFLAYRMGFINL